jgi:hypothetical protein
MSVHVKGRDVKTGRSKLLFVLAVCAASGAFLQRVRNPPGNRSLQPVAVGAAMDVRKSSEPSMERVV